MEIDCPFRVVVVFFHILVRVSGGVGAPKKVPLLAQFGLSEALRHIVVVFDGRDFVGGAVVLHLGVPFVPWSVSKE